MLSGRRTEACSDAVAIAAGDSRLTRVLGNYLVEREVFARCCLYCRGRDLLRELAEGAAFTMLVLDEQLLDMSAEEFLAGMAPLELSARPAVFVLTRYRYYELCEALRPYGVARYINRLTDPERLVRAICSWRSSCSARVAERCGWFYRRWGVQDHRRDCDYLTDAIQIVLNAGEERPLRKQIFADVGRRHGVSVAAVDSGIQRLVRAMEAADTAEYRSFLQHSELGTARLTPARLVYALAEVLHRLPAEGPERERDAADAALEPDAAVAAAL